ncbi:PDZ domain-containing protein [Lacticaseibacillus porcinae]|uniref:PDZ domain-containing protein n=1 Tax=Lacticaseibacillus porcinae TaxID=1123687 RepID=UPI000F76B731|nr:PDZ domain-containing protein [Lacticaseibacillus porcinae]
MRLFLTLLGPITWVGFLVAVFWHWLRLRHERKVFLTAIDRHATGLWAGVIGGVAVAIIISALSVLGGVLLSPAVLMMLSALSLVMLLLSGIGFGPWWLPIAGLLAIYLPQTRFAVGMPEAWTWRLLLLVGLLWLAEAGLLKIFDPPIDVPTIKQGPRGAKIAIYAHRQFYWLPLVLPISGTTFAQLPWWPALTIGNLHFALIGLPVILGVALRTKKQLPKTAIKLWIWQYLIAGLLALALTAGAWALPRYAVIWLGIAVIVGIAVGVANHYANMRGINYVSQTMTGVRLVAIQPETPAAKMGLEAGDVVLLCNQMAVHNDAELYAAIQAHPTYCRLKVMRLDGAIKLCETAIYEGAPHELGMITFAEEQA